MSLLRSNTPQNVLGDFYATPTSVPFIWHLHFRISNSVVVSTAPHILVVSHLLQKVQCSETDLQNFIPCLSGSFSSTTSLHSLTSCLVGQMFVCHKCVHIHIAHTHTLHTHAFCLPNPLTIYIYTHKHSVGFFQFSLPNLLSNLWLACDYSRRHSLKYHVQGLNSESKC